jgi:hypothetical protein
VSPTQAATGIGILTACSRHTERVDEMIAFLRARLDEDESLARASTANPVTRFGPDRMLREVAAKREIIALHSAEEGQHPDFCGHDLRELPCLTLRFLAAVYSDRPGYKPEWAG